MTQAVPGSSAPSRSEILDFLLESGTWRTGVLSVLLDALDASLNGGPVVVLGVRDRRIGSLWSGAVSMLSAPGTMDELRWQHVEDRAQVNADAHLVTTLPAQLDAWSGSGAVVVGEDDNCSLGEVAVDPHHTERGKSVTVTNWSLLAEAMLLDPETALQALELHESIDGKFARGTLHRLWPLAMTVASSPEMYESMGPAAHVIRAHSPWALVDQSDLFNVAVGAVAAGCGRDGAVEWRDRLSAGPVSEPTLHTPAPLIRLSEPATEPARTSNPVAAATEGRTLLMGEAADLSADTLQWRCTVSWTQPESATLDVDLVAFLLDEHRKVNGDEDFVFYNTPVGGNGAVELSVMGPDTQYVDIDFGALGSRYHRVALAIVITGNGSFSALNPLRMILTDKVFPMSDSICLHGTTEKAMIVGEFYMRAGRWRVRPIWQGYEGGLAELATSYGVVVDGHG